MEPQPVIILVVDDEAALRVFMSEALQDGGYTVLEAGTADEAFKALSEHAGNLGGLVTDIHLHGSEAGWEIARRAREVDPALPVVYVTGAHAEGWASRGVPHSVLLEKPFASADLVVALADLRKTS